MGIGINLGNTLDAPEEGDWDPPAAESNFEEFKAANFTNVRVPVCWDKHTATDAPYLINSTFLSRVETVLNWSLDRRLITIVNVHHDNWIYDPDTFEEKLPRFQRIWEQVAARFKDAPQELVFECLNEPQGSMTVVQLNKAMQTCVDTIRASNPTRIIMISGLAYANPAWIVQNPDALKVPNNDRYTMLTFHNYFP